MENKPPVDVGEVIKAEVRAFGTKGDPILKYQKYTLFLKGEKGVKLNTMLEVRVNKIFETFGFCELV